jgi:hypothetical protein
MSGPVEKDEGIMASDEQEPSMGHDPGEGRPHPRAAGPLTVGAYITTCLSGNYAARDERLWNLYQRGKTAQWNVATDIDWSPEVCFGSELRGEAPGTAMRFVSAPGSPVPPALWDTFRWEYQAWMVNQFLHGEQGALVATARLVETVPDMAAKAYGASQVADEARHVEAYARYIDEKLQVTYPINRGLESVLRDLLSDSRWDIVYLGMQIVIEGLALAATRVASTGFSDPIIKSISRMIARDEARHISFGVIALDGVYGELTTPELADREDFLAEAIHLMSGRFMLREVWERLDIDVRAGIRFAQSNPIMMGFRQTLFFKLVQALRHLGLLTPRICDLLKSESLVRPGILDDAPAHAAANQPRRAR